MGAYYSELEDMLRACCYVILGGSWDAYLLVGLSFLIITVTTRALMDQTYDKENGRKIFRFMKRLKTARSCQKSYADKRRKPLEFKVANRVFNEGIHMEWEWCAFDVQVPLDEIEIDENLRFVEEPIEIVERDVKKLKRRKIPLVKVRWNSRQGAEYTWEREDQFQKKFSFFL
ncbi:hypothetical protein Tco_0986835 [Tanacetum coccineum]